MKFREKESTLIVNTFIQNQGCRKNSHKYQSEHKVLVQPDYLSGNNHYSVLQE